MADNVLVTPGVGATIATDEVTDATLGTVQVQYTKLMDGTIDSTNKLVVSEDGSMQVGAVVNDTPNSYNPGDVKALSLTPEGRLRISSTPSDLSQCWQTTLDDPWAEIGSWGMENQYV